MHNLDITDFMPDIGTRSDFEVVSLGYEMNMLYVWEEMCTNIFGLPRSAL